MALRTIVVVATAPRNAPTIFPLEEGGPHQVVSIANMRFTRKDEFRDEVDKTGLKESQNTGKVSGLLFASLSVTTSVLAFARERRSERS